MAASHACCTVPAVKAEGYVPRGDYITADGLKTYATGPTSAKKAILVIMDVFGFFPQTIQGSDILAHGDEHQQYQVFIPDWFEGKPLPLHVLPADTKAKQDEFNTFLSTTANPEKCMTRIPKVLADLRSQRSGITDWAILGYCWGGKIANLMSQEGTEFKVAASCHPGMVDPADGEKTVIPFAMIPSGDEPKEEVNKWDEAVKVKHIVEWFPNAAHGFMAARADLSNPEVESDYKKGYRLLLNWFHETL